MNIIINHVYSEDNKGDAALLSVLVNDIRQVFGISTQITILSTDNVKENHTFEGVSVEKSFMHYVVNKGSNISKLLYSIFIIYTLIWAYVSKTTGISFPIPKKIHTLVLLYKNTNLVISVGGGYIRGKKGFRSTIGLMLSLHPFRLAKIFNKLIIGYPQSIGPFGNKFQEFLVKKHLKKFDILMIREDISIQLLNRLGITKNIVRTIDSGFLFESKEEKNLLSKLEIPTGKLIVGITVRNWLNPKEQKKYEKSFALFIDYVVKKYNARIILIPQVTSRYLNDDDREVNKRVYEYIQDKKEVILLNNNYNHHQIKSIYSNLNFLIGTRFHSVIFALTSYVPCLAIEYEHKTSGIMKDLGLKEWVIPMEEVDYDNLVMFFDKLVQNRDKYLAKLREKMPMYLQEAGKTREILKKFASKFGL